MQKRNIIFILTDQQHFRTLRTNGCQEAHTPNLDRMAGEGLNFRNHMVANPVCQPSRGAIWTGRMPSENGLYANGCNLPEDMPPTFVRELRKQGYYTAHFGKMHLVPCFNRVEPHPPGDFQEFACGEGDQWLLHDDYNMWFRAKDPQAFMRHYVKMMREPYDSPHTADIDEENTHNAWVTKMATDFLGKHSQQEPFFLSLGYFDPHHAFNPCEPYASRWKNAEVQLPQTRDDYWRTLPSSMQSKFKRILGKEKPEYLRDVLRAYYAMMEHIDDCIGRLLEQLKSTGLMENTIIVFSSDHGEFLGNHGRLFKGGFLLDDLLRVPLIIWDGNPQQRASTQVETVTSSLDFYATFLSLAQCHGSAFPDGTEPLVNHELKLHPKGKRGYALSEWRFPPLNQNDGNILSIRTQDHRLTLYPNTSDDEGELYEHARDPYELNNIYHDAVQENTRGWLSAILRQHAPVLPLTPEPATLW